MFPFSIGSRNCAARTNGLMRSVSLPLSNSANLGMSSEDLLLISSEMASMNSGFERVE